MESSEEYTTSEIPEFTRVPGSQVKSVVHDHTRLHCKDQNWESVQDTTFSFASINKLELNKIPIVKGIEQAIQSLTL